MPLTPASDEGDRPQQVPTSPKPGDSKSKPWPKPYKHDERKPRLIRKTLLIGHM